MRLRGAVEDHTPPEQLVQEWRVLAAMEELPPERQLAALCASTLAGWSSLQLQDHILLLDAWGVIQQKQPAGGPCLLPRPLLRAMAGALWGAHGAAAVFDLNLCAVRAGAFMDTPAADLARSILDAGQWGWPGGAIRPLPGAGRRGSSMHWRWLAAGGAGCQMGTGVPARLPRKAPGAPSLFQTQHSFLALFSVWFFLPVVVFNPEPRNTSLWSTLPNIRMPPATPTPHPSPPQPSTPAPSTCVRTSSWRPPWGPCSQWHPKHPAPAPSRQSCTCCAPLLPRRWTRWRRRSTGASPGPSTPSPATPSQACGGGSWGVLGCLQQRKGQSAWRRTGGTHPWPASRCL